MSVLWCVTIAGRLACFQFFTGQLQNTSWAIFGAEHILCDICPDAEHIQGGLRFTIIKTIVDNRLNILN